MAESSGQSVGTIYYEIGVRLAPDAKQKAGQLGQELQAALNRISGSPVAADNSPISKSLISNTTSNGGGRISPGAVIAGTGFIPPAKGTAAAVGNVPGWPAGWQQWGAPPGMGGAGGVGGGAGGAGGGFTPSPLGPLPPTNAPATPATAASGGARNVGNRLGLFGRFLSYAAFHEGINVARATRQHSIEVALAGNDNRAQLQAELDYREKITSGVFGGAIGFMSDPSGRREAIVRSQLNAADTQDETTKAMTGYGEYRRGLRDDANVAGYRPGAGREIASARNDLSGDVREARKRNTDALASERKRITADVRAEVAALPDRDPQITSRMASGDIHDLPQRVAYARAGLEDAAIRERMADPTAKLKKQLSDDIENVGKAFVGKIKDITEKLSVQAGISRGEQRVREGYGLSGSMRAIAAAHRVNGDGSVDGLSPDMLGFGDALESYKGDQSDAVVNYGRTVLGSLNRRAVNNRLLARDPLGAALAGRHGQFLNDTLGMNPNSPDYQRAQDDEHSDDAVTRQRIGDSYAQINLGLRAQIGQNRLLAQYKPIEAGFLGLNAGAQAQLAQAQLTGSQTLIDNARAAGTTSIDAGMANFLRSLRPTEGSINRVDFSGGQTGNESFDDIVAAAAAAKDAIDKADPLKTFAPDLGPAGAGSTAAQEQLLTNIYNVLTTIRDTKTIISAQ